jgi:hypothetical protein
MPTPEEAIEIVRAFAHSFSSGKPIYEREGEGGDIDKILSFLSDDIWWSENCARFVLCGKPPIRKLFEKVYAGYPNEIIRPTRIFSDGHNCCMEWEITFLREGNDLIFTGCTLLKLTKDGKIYHWVDHYFSPEALEAYNAKGLLDH